MTWISQRALSHQPRFELGVSGQGLCLGVSDREVSYGCI